MLKLDKIFVTSSIDVLSIDIAWWLLNLIMTLIIKFEYTLPDMREKGGEGWGWCLKIKELANCYYY